MEQSNLLLELLDVAELVFSFAVTMWELISQPLYQILNINIDAVPEWAQSLISVLDLSLIEFIIGAVGFFVVASIVKWVIGVIKGS